jgi:hypothetical protein
VCRARSLVDLIPTRFDPIRSEHSLQLEHGRSAHSGSDAHRNHTVAGFPTPHLVEESGSHACTRAAERMTERDRTTVHIDPRLVNAQFSDTVERLAGERLSGEGAEQE